MSVNGLLQKNVGLSVCSVEKKILKIDRFIVLCASEVVKQSIVSTCVRLCVCVCVCVCLKYY